jgi:multiple sugar transport system ATP-binding protein
VSGGPRDPTSSASGAPPPSSSTSAPAPVGASVALRGLAKRFGPVEAVRPLDLDVAGGELLVLLGPSGCGKSTVLRMIAGLEEPSAGEVVIAGRPVNDLEPAERDVAMVFQSYALYPHMRVRENLAFALRMRGASRAEVERRVRWAAGMLGLETLLERRPGQLSGGQRQRVALGRALVREPAVFLFDEPLSNLDARLRLEMRDEIAALHRRLGTTMVFVTHDQVEAMSLGQRIAILSAGELQQVGAPLEVYDRPANLFVARFIGSPPINTVEGVVGHDGGGPVFMAGGLTLAGTGAADGTGGAGDGAFEGPAVLGIRPEGLDVVADVDPRADLRAVVRRREALGSELLLHLDGPEGEPWVARVPPTHAARVDERVGVVLDAPRAHLFDGVTGVRVGALAPRDGA